MESVRFDAMTRAIVGFELDGQRLRGTLKLNQHKPEEELKPMVSGQSRAGRADLAEAIEAHWLRARER